MCYQVAMDISYGMGSQWLVAAAPESNEHASAAKTVFCI